ncbi:virulence factor MviN [Cellulomonas sp. ACRRI]|uniref:murein biosynthesis integral membrane protein MurJ n=1 Tax=Cellulomonas sp. ACRRI TaxID=2918188 RepID=UPI001EF1A5B4|nr:lipid II flippase MurJ [Cellulomonas sp. ACRRI]MCG7285913.1 virulence factor MviN [Cellulomonas sp. ACRRI]
MSRRAVLSGLAGAAALISAVTVVSRLLGFARNLVFTNAVGLTDVGDAYNWANTLPNVLFEVAAGGALAGALIPVIAGPLARGMRDDVSRIASAMLGWTLGGLVLIGAVLALAAEPIAALSRVDTAAERDLVTFFVRVFAVQLPLYGLAVVLSGVLQAQRRFFWPAFAPVLSSLVVIGAYAGYGRLLADAGVAGGAGEASLLPDGAAALLAWGTTAGVAAMGLCQVVPVWRSGVRLRPALRFPDGVAARARGLALAGIGALVAQQLAVLVTITLAQSYGGEGALSAWQTMVQPTYLLPYAVLAVPLATSTFPRLAAAAQREGRPGYAPLAAVTTRGVLVAGATGAAMLVAVAPAATAVFRAIGRGNTDLIAAVADALTLVAPGLLGFALVFHVSRALYALERGRLAVLAASAGWLTVAAASWVACVALVPGGRDAAATLHALSLGNTIGMVVAGVALLAVLRAAAGAEAVAGLTRTLAVLVGAGAVAGVVGRWVVDAVQALTDGIPGAVVAAAGGAAVVVVLVVGAVAVLDRSTVTGLLRRGGPGGAAGAGVAADALVPGTDPGPATTPAADAGPAAEVPHDGPGESGR